GNTLTQVPNARLYTPARTRTTDLHLGEARAVTASSPSARVCGCGQDGRAPRDHYVAGTTSVGRLSVGLRRSRSCREATRLTTSRYARALASTTSTLAARACDRLPADSISTFASPKASMSWLTARTR